MRAAPAIDANRSSEAEASRPKTRRRSLRRAVTLECNLESEVWDGIVVLPATDLSAEGLWLETPYALDEGEELVVSFEVPNAPEPTRIWAIATVARVGLFRRRGEAQASGMGLVFTYCSEDDHMRLRAALEGRPPPLPEYARGASLPPPLPLPSSARARGGDTGLADEDTLPAVLDWLLASE
jgi:hypothetical protein